MKLTSEKMNAQTFITMSFALIIDAVLEAMTDRTTNEQLSELIKAYGPDSEIVKPLAALKAAKDEEAREEIFRLLKDAEDQKMPLLTMSHDDVAMLAAKFSMTNKEIGSWRRRHVVEMAIANGLITDEDIQLEVFVSDLALDQLTAKLIKDGKLVRDGNGYRVPGLAKAS